MRVRRQFVRWARVGVIFAAAMVLASPPAVAVVTPTVVGGSVALISDGARDTINLSCVAGQLRFGMTDLVACNATLMITINGQAGNDSVDLTALQPADFPALANVAIDGGLNSDNLKGSFFGDTIAADVLDTVQGFGGDDTIVGGDQVFGGDGDDVLRESSHSVDGGPGDDRIVQPGPGPYDGGPGTDSWESDQSFVAAAPNLNYVVTDSMLHVDVVSPPFAVNISSVAIERYVFVFPHSGSHTWTSSAFSGSVDVLGGFLGDTMVAGPGEDFLDGSKGNDQLTGGTGFDYLTGGQGDDTVFVQDGAVDRVICGDGNDTVVADAGDLLTGCEAVQLPPSPPAPQPPPAPPVPVVPETGKVRGPKTVDQGEKAKFRFSSPTTGATFQCKLDKKAWKACKSPRKVATTNLKASKDGTKHVFKVRAVLAGVVDKTPSKKTFKVVKP